MGLLGGLVIKKQMSYAQFNRNRSLRIASLNKRLIRFRQGALPTFFLTETAKRLHSASAILYLTPIGPKD
jgi:hypothetical protein